MTGPKNNRNYKAGVNNVCIAVFTLVAGLLARNQNPEVPAIGHYVTGFSWFPVSIGEC